VPPQLRATWASLIGPQLLAQILFDKYRAHLPLNRQSDIYAKQGVDLDRLAGIVGRHNEAHPFDKLEFHPDHALRNNPLPKFNIVKRYVT